MEIQTVPKGSSVAEIEISYKPLVKLSSLAKIKSSQDLYHLLLETWDKSKLEFVEQFKVILLNRNHRILGICTISSGCGTNTIADPKMIFGVALKCNAGIIVLVHNHPSGNLLPSNCDNDHTRKIKEGAKLLDILVLDHLIVTSEGYYSYADEGAL